MLTLKNFTVATTGLFAACALGLSSAACAGPHGGPGPGPHHAAPAPAPVHHGGPSHRSWHSGDYAAMVLAPLAAGAIIYGVTQAAKTPSYTVVQQPTYVAPQTVYTAPASTTTTTTTVTTTTTAAKTVYWCEAEQGWWPNVRACPTGWKAMPAP